MIEFHYPRGHLRFRTMTVGELREALAQFPDDKAVLLEWEGIHVQVTAERIAFRETGLGGSGPKDAVIIDADQY